MAIRNNAELQRYMIMWSKEEPQIYIQLTLAFVVNSPM